MLLTEENYPVDITDRYFCHFIEVLQIVNLFKNSENTQYYSFALELLMLDT
jgi:hypothetical protein